MPGGRERATHLWTDEDFALPRGRFRTYQSHHIFRTKARPVRQTKPVPIKGAFAGLSPKRLIASGGSAGDPEPLRAQAQAWNDEAAQIERDLPTLTLAEQIGQGLVTHQIRVRDLVASWDGEGRGSIVKSEFRMRFRGLIERLHLVYPGTKAIDAMYDEYDADGSGVIDTKELISILEMLQAAGQAAREKFGQAYMEKVRRIAPASHIRTPFLSLPMIP